MLQRAINCSKMKELPTKSRAVFERRSELRGTLFETSRSLLLRSLESLGLRFSQESNGADQGLAAQKRPLAPLQTEFKTGICPAKFFEIGWSDRSLGLRLS